MPLVRIDVHQGRAPEELRRIADTVHDVMLEVFAAPPGDRYQVITEHPVGHIIAEDTGLGFERTTGVTVIQIVQQGRTTEQKKAVYRELASRLQVDCALDPTDLIVSIVTNGPDDWSFGLGRAQFLEGDL
jgi:phenylpyruvate tautomerase PptA (4-oxalocrotonate tautomerase family)